MKDQPCFLQSDLGWHACSGWDNPNSGDTEIFACHFLVDEDPAIICSTISRHLLFSKSRHNVCNKEFQSIAPLSSRWEPWCRNIFLMMFERLSMTRILWWRNRRHECHSTSVGQLVRTPWRQDLWLWTWLSHLCFGRDRFPMPEPVAISSWQTHSPFSLWTSSTCLFIPLERTIHEVYSSFFMDFTWISIPYCSSWHMTLTWRTGPIFVYPRIQPTGTE